MQHCVRIENTQEESRGHRRPKNPDSYESMVYWLQSNRILKWYFFSSNYQSLVSDAPSA